MKPELTQQIRTMLANRSKSREQYALEKEDREFGYREIEFADVCEIDNRIFYWLRVHGEQLVSDAEKLEAIAARGESFSPAWPLTQQEREALLVACDIIVKLLRSQFPDQPEKGTEP
jgi:hypothetical protein